MATKSQMRQAAELLGIPDDLLDQGEKSSPLEPEKPWRRSRDVPGVFRSYRPSEEHQIKAISALLRDAINTLPMEKGSPTAKAPRSAEGSSDESCARGSMP